MNISSDVKPSDNLSENGSQTSQKMVLHFSDGVMEVDEEIEETRIKNSQAPIDPKQLNWAPWMWYQTAIAGSKALQVCDYLGESLASLFGITTPKYQFEINEYNRMKKAEEEAQRERDLEIGGWINKNDSQNSDREAVSSPPNKVQVENVTETAEGGDNSSALKY